MTRPRDQVAERLELLNAPGAALHVTSENATIHLYADDWRRQDVRDDVIDSYLARQDDVTTYRRLAVVMSGPPGSGKSSLAAAYAASQGDDATVDDAEGCATAMVPRPSHRVIDSDVVKDSLLERGFSDSIFDSYLGWQLPDDRPLMLRELSGLVHLESLSIADDLRRICMDRGEDLVIEGTLRHGPYASRLLNELDDHAYRGLTILGAEVEEDVAIQRALERWWEVRDGGVDSKGGRFMPRSAIIDCYPVPGARSVCWGVASGMFEQAKADGAFQEVVLAQVEDGVRHEQRYFKPA